MNTVSSMHLLTKHVQCTNGVGLQGFDGVIHIVRRRGWRCQVIDLIHCEKQENKSCHLLIYKKNI